MGFDISKMYEQTGQVFYLCINVFLNIAYVMVLLPSPIYAKIFKFLTGQVVIRGELQSGNVSIIFVGLLIIAFLLNHLSNWAESVLYPKMAVKPERYSYLIAHRFFNIVTLYNSREQKALLLDVINDSFVRIFSQENPNSTVSRSLGVGQRKWAFYKNFAGTFKLTMYLSIMLSLYRLVHNFSLLFICYYLSIAVISLLLWFFVNNMLSYIIWNMFNSYWHQQETSIPKENSYLSKIYNRDYSNLMKKSWNLGFKYRLSDIKNGWKILWK